MFAIAFFLLYFGIFWFFGGEVPRWLASSMILLGLWVLWKFICED